MQREPVRGGKMKGRDESGKIPLKFSLQESGEQVVIAEPLPILI